MYYRKSFIKSFFQSTRNFIGNFSRYSSSNSFMDYLKNTSKDSFVNFRRLLLGIFFQKLIQKNLLRSPPEVWQSKCLGHLEIIASKSPSIRPEIPTGFSNGFFWKLDVCLHNFIHECFQKLLEGVLKNSSGNCSRNFSEVSLRKPWLFFPILL